MNISNLIQKKRYILDNRTCLDKNFLDKKNKDFVVRYSHDTTAIEGNTLSLMETKLLLEDQISPYNKYVREIFEIINAKRAYLHIKEIAKDGTLLSLATIKDIHEILMDNILQGGIFRNQNIMITGASHDPPPPTQAYHQVNYPSPKGNGLVTAQ